jgi:hypothetical protein
MFPRFLYFTASLHVAGAPAGPPGPGRAAPDSVAVLHSARRAQATFEWQRRRHVPAGPGNPFNRCDARIGRFCYWYEEGGNSTPKEPDDIRAGRDQLLATLAEAGARLPGDEWITGQRVRYLVEAGKPQTALAVALGCSASTWWCAALRGLALHAAGDIAGADSSFATALVALPPAERCRWTDISALLDDALRDRYERSSCEEREELAARWWWLATPLFSRPANDRRTEHFARVTLARIEDGGANPYGLRWGDDLRELLIRYGEPTYWTEDRPATALHEAAIGGHEPTPSFHFGPAPHALVDPAEARPEDWAVGTPLARERYAPAYARHVTPLEAQIATYRRGDSLLVVAAFDLSHDTAFADGAPHGALVLARDDHVVARGVRHTLAPQGEVLMARAPAEPLLVSLEVLDTVHRSAARTRFGLGHPERAARVSLSDVLLFDPPDSLPTTLTDVLPFVRPSGRVATGQRLGLFWEIYGLDPAGEVVTTSLELSGERRGWLRRAIEAVGLAHRSSAVRLRWDEAPSQEGGTAPRALVLDLSGLAPGRYRIELSVSPAGYAPVTVQREIHVVRR